MEYYSIIKKSEICKQIDEARNNHPEEDKEVQHASLKSGWDVAIDGIDMCASFLLHTKDSYLVREQGATEDLPWKNMYNTEL